MARPKLGDWQANNKAPIFAYWKGERRVVAMMTKAANGYFLVNVITGTNPPDTFTTETLALIWLEVYLQRPDAYTKDDAISEMLDRWGHHGWFKDVREAVDSAGPHLELWVDADIFPQDDDLPRSVGPKKEKIYFVVIPQRLAKIPKV